VFVGVATADMRALAKQFSTLSYVDIARLMKSKIHEERQVALFILVRRYETGSLAEQRRVFDFYLRSTSRINNWDLVDLSAPKIVGPHIIGKSRAVLNKLAQSQNMWERRIAILATLAFIRVGDFTDTLRLSRLFINERHDLMHKATGWMLREVGKRSRPTLEKFLKRYYQRMPRTMLRYAIERLPEPRRQAYLKGLI
jgi:3-methyladenine DNA glycosylase AlkD